MAWEVTEDGGGSSEPVRDGRRDEGRRGEVGAFVLWLCWGGSRDEMKSSDFFSYVCFVAAAAAAAAAAAICACTCVLCYALC
jgi:hypothetical protein